MPQNASVRSVLLETFYRQCCASFRTEKLDQQVTRCCDKASAPQRKQRKPVHAAYLPASMDQEVQYHSKSSLVSKMSYICKINIVF